VNIDAPSECVAKRTDLLVAQEPREQRREHPVFKLTMPD
jgi:hypothetical protein